MNAGDAPVAQGPRALRYINGTLSVETIQTKPLFDGDQLRDLTVESTSRALEAVEGQSCPARETVLSLMPVDEATMSRGTYCRERNSPAQSEGTGLGALVA